MTETRPRRAFFRAADDHDEWAWRSRLRANRTTRIALRTTVALVGLVLVLGGFALVPLPGPGWLIVILGLAVWASEIEPAADLLEWVKKQVRRWEEWVRAQPLGVKALVGLLTFAFVLAVVWLALRLTGVPSFLPDGIEGWLHAHAAL
ncbi:PGPGW domain-containing protein [Phycicoccus sonneratiae]|uniref:TIGR02611 family protein n=1 Tax=Phycicoccus sonneratiae TaxID=2807628 RepID=A0ABS2CIY9_9MICO|nr:PGPGW domain-containing protein [Phycicoccus sonneraticus]MBM6399750.1 TIGR02611 family protein [Phycicoccus sonneraticus]